MRLCAAIFLLVVVKTTRAFSVLPRSSSSATTKQSSVLLYNNKNGPKDDEDDTMNPITKSSWYAVEWFGKAFGSADKQKQQDNGDDDNDNDNTLDTQSPPKSIEETLQRIKLDNDRSYFLSGEVDEPIYDPDCVFRDPFVSFEGRERFVTNLANLGSFITKYDAKVLKYAQIDNGSTVRTKVRMSLFGKRLFARITSEFCL
jgi:hypothetical protein